MRLNTVPARQGFVWVRRGFSHFLQRPLGFTLLLASFLFAALVMLLLPFVGVVMLLMALPLVSLGFMVATRRAVANETSGPAVLIEGLRGPPARRQAMLGLLGAYAVANILVMLLSDTVDAGRFEALQKAMTGEDAADPQVLAGLLGDPRLFWGMVVRLGLTTLVSLPFWHAPALVHWEGQGVAQALFTSSVACWRNKAALLVYGLGWLGLVMLFSVLANTLVALLGEPRMLALAAMPAALMFSTAFYVSLYFIYTDCFVPDAPRPPAAPETPQDHSSEDPR
jgi:hypothetical protein